MSTTVSQLVRSLRPTTKMVRPTKARLVVQRAGQVLVIERDYHELVGASENLASMGWTVRWEW